MSSMQLRPSFWGIDRDLKSILDDMEGVWDGNHLKTSLTNFHETDQAYLATLDMPGMNKSNLDIQIEESQVRIVGTRIHQRIEGKKQNEEKVSKFVSIPKDVDIDKIQAHCEDGVLYLAFPKIEKMKPKKLKVSNGDLSATWDKLLAEKKESHGS
jgi:HSP20 family protein